MKCFKKVGGLSLQALAPLESHSFISLFYLGAREGADKTSGCLWLAAHGDFLEVDFFLAPGGAAENQGASKKSKSLIIDH